MPLTEALKVSWIYTLYQIGQIETDKDDTVYSQILRHVVDGFKADTGSLVLYHGEDRKSLNIVAGIGLPERYVGSEIPENSGVFSWVIENKQAVLLKGSISDDPRFTSPIPKKETPIPQTALCWPLLGGKRLIGALSINRLDDKVVYTDRELENGQILVNLITLVIDNYLLHRDEQKRIHELAASHERNYAAHQQLQETHRRLEESEKRLSDILDSLDSIVWSMEPIKLDMIYLNKAAAVVSGREVVDFFNNSHLWLDIIYPRDRQRMENCLNELMTSMVQKITYRIVHPDGELRWLYNHMRIINDEAGKPLRIDGISVDITQHKHAEDLLKQRNQELQSAFDKIHEVQGQLVQSEKMASVGQLAAGVAHEINNPIGYINSNLTSLKNYVQDLLALVTIYETAEPLLADSAELKQIASFKTKIDLDFLKSDVMDLLDESHEGAFRVKKIVQDLKDFSHAGGDEDWQWADLHSCLDSTLNIVNNEIKYKAGIVKQYGEIPNAWCLPHQLNQVFMNLLVNAAHAIEKEGTITVSTGMEENNIWVEVRDTGKGIAQEHVSKIFDPFFTTKPVGKGTGLGLSVSYNIVKKHKGEICVDSRLGEGTAFRIILPQKSAEAVSE